MQRSAAEDAPLQLGLRTRVIKEAIQIVRQEIIGLKFTLEFLLRLEMRSMLLKIAIMLRWRLNGRLITLSVLIKRRLLIPVESDFAIVEKSGGLELRVAVLMLWGRRSHVWGWRDRWRVRLLTGIHDLNRVNDYVSPCSTFLSIPRHVRLRAGGSRMATTAACVHAPAFFGFACATCQMPANGCVA